MMGNEFAYIKSSIEENWVSTSGPFVNRFEEALSKYVSSDYAVALQSGTAGLHLALKVLGVNQDSEVFVPSLTFIASVNPIRYLGAEPIFLDVDDSLCIDNKSLERFIQNNCCYTDGKLINKLTKKRIIGIVYVHVFGNTGDFELTMDLAKKHNLFVLEDATEALGSRYIDGEFAGKFLGTIGDVGVYSFNGNKIITTGGGGMVVTNNTEYAERIRYLSTQAKDDKVFFIHNEIGYNYRMTSTQAAMGLGQLELIDYFILIKMNNYNYYKSKIEEYKDKIHFLEFNKSLYPNYWFYSLFVGVDSVLKLKTIIQHMDEHGIECRPIWKLNHLQEPYKMFQKTKLGNSEKYYRNVINLPCSSNLKHDDIDYVIDILFESLVMPL
jgi:perosamine synthetase